MYTPYTYIVKFIHYHSSSALGVPCISAGITPVPCSSEALFVLLDSTASKGLANALVSGPKGLFRALHQKKPPIPNSISAPSVAPTPIPAAAPTESPVDDEALVSEGSEPVVISVMGAPAVLLSLFCG